MRLLKLMILPLIIASLIAGSASLNAKMSGKIAVRTLLYFILTSMFNAFLGLVLAMAIHPGVPEIKQFGSYVEGKREHSILDSILDIGRCVLVQFGTCWSLLQADWSYHFSLYHVAIAGIS